MNRPILDDYLFDSIIAYISTENGDYNNNVVMGYAIFKGVTV